MEIWKQFAEATEASFEKFKGALNSGLSENDIVSFSTKYGLDLPSDFVELYTQSNGQNDSVNAYFFGMEFLKLDSVSNAIDAELDVMDQLEDQGDMCSSFPEKHIKCAYVNPKWVPIFHGGGGSYIGLDLDPDTKGKVGQVINFGNDDEDKIVLSDSLSEFFLLCLSKIKSGKDINYHEELGMYFYTESYFVSALYQEIRGANA